MLGGLDFHTIAAHVRRSLATAGASIGTLVVSGAATLGSLVVSGLTRVRDDFTIYGSSDSTKGVRFEVDGVTAGQTRVITPPDVDVTLPYKPGTYGSVQIFTADGTWSKPAGVVRVRVTVVGAGGGGGGAATTGAGETAGGDGGAGGGFAIKTIEAASLGATETVTVGEGGAGGSAGGNNGSTGETSSFGSHCSATGGSGGAGGVANSTHPGPNTALGIYGNFPGGIGADGDINGEGGTNGLAIRWSTGSVRAGQGGSSFFSGEKASGGTVTLVNGGGGVEATSPGQGGTGGFNAQNQGTARAGGAGADGVVIVEEFF